MYLYVKTALAVAGGRGSETSDGKSRLDFDWCRLPTFFDNQLWRRNDFHAKEKWRTVQFICTTSYDIMSY